MTCLKSEAKFHSNYVVPERPGITAARHGFIFTAIAEENKEAKLLLYHKGADEPFQEVDLPEEKRVGEVAAVELDIPEEEAADGNLEYTFLIDGKIKTDPRAVRLTEDRRGVVCRPAHAETCQLHIPYEDMILYKLNVRGYTMDPSAESAYPGTFKGLADKIPYLKELGVNALLLMPVYDFNDRVKVQQTFNLSKDIQVLDGNAKKERKNFWGYAPGFYFAPKRSYSASLCPDREFADLVDAMHKEGMEVLLEFYFKPDASECFIKDVLHFWLTVYHVDGFHITGNETCAAAICRDPMLKKTKLIYSDPFLIDQEGQKKGGRRTLASSNQGYEQDMRRFLKGDEDLDLAGIQWNLRRNSVHAAYINYFADQDGFTMADMVSYEHRHNEDNGENNKDGSRTNYSWNCGDEGPSDRLEVVTLRRHQLNNAFLMLFTGQGVPMIYAGDEFLNSQSGNNNVWCQDNAAGWVNWSRTKDAEDRLQMVKDIIRFRRENRILHMKAPLRMQDYKATGYPDLSVHTSFAWADYDDRTRIGFALLMDGSYADPSEEKERFIYLVCNMYWETQEFALPDLPEGYAWALKADSHQDKVVQDKARILDPEILSEKKISASPRSILILTGEKVPVPKKRRRGKSAKAAAVLQEK
ncbi:MAG: alpha-amylase family glycosyl hydrolase [Eubacterium sp.]|nr:alpha-amylase family glycosyl hydrolase [Eubacterium sp.]